MTQNRHPQRSWTKFFAFLSGTTILGLFALVLVLSQSHSVDKSLDKSFSFRSVIRSIASTEAGAKSYDYLEMFRITRELMSRKEFQKVLKEEFEAELTLDEARMAQFGIDDPKALQMTETQFMLILQHNPEIWDDLEEFASEVTPETPEDAPIRQEWRARFTEIFGSEELREEFRTLNDPTEALFLKTEDGKPSIKNLELYANHSRDYKGESVPGDDLVKKITDFIDNAEKEITFNVFDFDHMDIADALIRAHKRGVVVTGGIDNDVIAHRPEVKAVYDKLVAAGTGVKAIDSTGLNHQKIISTDWSIKGKGKVLLSSGNFTHSGLNPKGDLSHLPDEIRPAGSLPNANHLITLDSDLMSQVVHHQLDKTIGYEMRGAEFPISGVYHFEGLNSSRKKFPMYLTFTPGGAYKNVNNNLIGRIIREGKGPVEMAQFAFSSQEVVDALLERAKKEIAETGTFDFRSVGHAGFAMQFWSGFLEMSGLQRPMEPESLEKGIYMVDKDSAWRRLFRSQEEFDEFRDRIRIGPDEYRDMVWLEVPNQETGEMEKVQISAKIHHKSLVSGGENSPYEWVISGSFNFSAGAEGNNEQIYVIRDPEFGEKFHGIVSDLYRKSTTSVFEDALRRNHFSLTELKELARKEAANIDADLETRMTFLQAEKALLNALVPPSCRDSIIDLVPGVDP